MEIPWKTRNKTAIRSHNPITGHIPWGNHNWERYMYPNDHYSTVYNSYDMEATYMSIDRWLDKEAVVHMYNGLLLSHGKEYIWVRSNEVDEPRAYYTEWSKSEREKQISLINVYMWNLERWYWCWTSFQGSNGDTDTEKRFVDTMGEGVGGTNWEGSIRTYTSPYVK